MEEKEHTSLLEYFSSVLSENEISCSVSVERMQGTIQCTQDKKPVDMYTNLLCSEPEVLISIMHLVEIMLVLSLCTETCEYSVLQQ